MHKVVKAELFKLKRNKAYWFILLLSFGIYLALGLMTDEKISFQDAIASSASIVPLFSALVAISVAQADYNDGTMKNVVSTGISRTSIYIGKLLAAYIGCMGIFLIEAIMSVGFSVYGGATVTMDAFFIIKAVLLQAVVVLNYTVIFFLLGSIIHSAALAVSLSFAYYLFGAFAFGYVGSFLHISGLADYELGSVATAIEQVNVNTVTMLHLGIVTIIILFFTYIGAFCFNRQEIK